MEEMIDNHSTTEELTSDLTTTSTLNSDLDPERSDQESESVDLITDEQYHYILVMFMLLWLIFSLGGFLTNIVNILTFLRMRLEDSVTISFFVLSLSDCGASLVGFFHATTAVLRVVQREQNMLFKMDPFAFAVFCAHYRRMLYDMSVLTTTFLAVQRCCCVAFPFHFKGVFTRKRTVVVLVCICIFSVLCYLPMFLTHGLVLGVDPATNMTRYILWMSDSRSYFIPVTEIITAIIMPTATQIINIICLIVMAVCLKKSSEFRKFSGLAKPVTATKQTRTPFAISISPVSVHPVSNSNISSIIVADEDEKSFGVAENSVTPDGSRSSVWTERDVELLGRNTESKTKDGIVKQPAVRTSKEMQVIKAVGLVSIVFVVCNTPKIITANLRQFIPGFDVQGRLFNIYLVGNCFRLTFELFNSAVNLFIYYNFNTKFKSLCVLRCGQCIRSHGSNHMN